MDETFRRAAEGFKPRALELFPSRLKRVVVFGSVARGQAGPDSDLDLCVLVDEVDPQLHDRLPWSWPKVTSSACCNSNAV